MRAALASPPGVVPGLTRLWVRLYCMGMSEQARVVRLLEIESDLWEHFADRSMERISPAAINVEALGRMLRGVPSDIAWRIQAEGFHVNIQFPVERLAGLLLLFLIVPFIAGTAISGYDTGRTEWPGEFLRFSEMSSRSREGTALLHGAIGWLTIAGVAWLYATMHERSPRLIAVACALLAAAGTIMLVNAALYRAMSGLADGFTAGSDASLVTTARGFALSVEALSMANASATTSGLFCLGTALIRLGMVPRWTLVLPAAGFVGTILWTVLGPVFGDAAWLAITFGFIAVALWLLICGIWLLVGGSKLQSMKGLPAHT